MTKLLVATKQLLEGLTLWSTRKMSEEQVSDIFVQLATQFNLASQSFHEVGIDTRYERERDKVAVIGLAGRAHCTAMQFILGRQKQLVRLIYDMA